MIKWEWCLPSDPVFVYASSVFGGLATVEGKKVEPTVTSFVFRSEHFVCAFVPFYSPPLLSFLLSLFALTAATIHSASKK